MSGVTLVTGGGAGIGRAAARAFAARGDRVVVADLDPRPEEVAAGLDSERFRFVRLDVSDTDAVHEVVARIAGDEGSLDVVHNNAGVASRQVPLHEVSVAEWDRVIGTNLRGCWNVLAAALRIMRKQGRGSIVNTASIGAAGGLAERGPYCAAKAGVVAMTRVAALENGSVGIRVNAVLPGTIETELSIAALGGVAPTGPDPVGRLGSPDEVAAAVVWLSSSAASYVNGACLTVDGGWTVGVPPRTSTAGSV
ncbi:MAG TPA: SDR family NAD(P)-dependent oxidoreductase [Amycolatopsis sp.]|nr:SDR family NAD(P)-dependent oxidoreductase [Amycolatopsis sp.]